MGVVGVALDYSHYSSPVGILFCSTCSAKRLHRRETCLYGETAKHSHVYRSWIAGNVSGPGGQVQVFDVTEHSVYYCF